MGGQYLNSLKTVGGNKSNWVDSAQYRDSWRVLVNAELRIWIQ